MVGTWELDFFLKKKENDIKTIVMLKVSDFDKHYYDLKLIWIRLRPALRSRQPFFRAGSGIALQRSTKKQPVRVLFFNNT